MKRWIALALIALTLAACGQGPETRPAEPLTGKAFIVTGTYITRFHDDELGVTCWMTTGGYQGGISCLPDTQLKGR